MMSAHPRPHANSPWVIDTRALGRRPGTLRALRLAAPVDEPIGLDVVAVPPGADVDLDLRLEAVAEGVLVSGTAAATAVGQCSRCLIDLTEPVIARIRELYAYPDSTTAATTDDDEIARLVDDLVDLEPLVRDEVVLALPMAPLCRPDCPGLCAECGERFDDLEPGHSHEILDPRWAALRDRFDVNRRYTREHGPATLPGPASKREGDRSWLSRRGRCRAATPVRVVRSGRPPCRPW